MRPEKPNLNEIVLDQCRKRKISRESNFTRARSRRRKLGTVSSNRKISLNSSVLFGKHENNNPIALSAFTSTLADAILNVGEIVSTAFGALPSFFSQWVGNLVR